MTSKRRKAREESHQKKSRSADQRLLQRQIRQKCEMEVRISSVPVMAEPHWQGAHSPETVAAEGRLSDYTGDKADKVSCFLFMIASLWFYSDYQSSMCSL